MGEEGSTLSVENSEVMREETQRDRASVLKDSKGSDIMVDFGLQEEG